MTHSTLRNRRSLFFFSEDSRFQKRHYSDKEFPLRKRDAFVVKKEGEKEREKEKDREIERKINRKNAKEKTKVIAREETEKDVCED